MRKPVITLFVGLSLIALSGQARAQTNPGGGPTCVTCANGIYGDQDCVPLSGAGAAGCNLFYEGGVRYCNWFGTCPNSGGFSMLNLSAAGTVASSTITELRDGTIVSTCNALIVAHAWSAPNRQAFKASGVQRSWGEPSIPEEVAIRI